MVQYLVLGDDNTLGVGALKGDEKKIILVQYGLVKSWKTFKYSPYIFYYPENRISSVKSSS